MENENDVTRSLTQLVLPVQLFIRRGMEKSLADTCKKKKKVTTTESKIQTIEIFVAFVPRGKERDILKNLNFGWNKTRTHNSFYPFLMPINAFDILFSLSLWFPSFDFLPIPMWSVSSIQFRSFI